MITQSVQEDLFMMHLMHNSTGFYIDRRCFNARCEIFKILINRSFGNTLKITDNFSDDVFMFFINFIEQNEKEFRPENLVELLAISDVWKAPSFNQVIMNQMCETHISKEEILKQFVDLIKRDLHSISVETLISENLSEFIKLPTFSELSIVEIQRILIISNNIHNNKLNKHSIHNKHSKHSHQSMNINHGDFLITPNDVSELVEKCIYKHGEKAFPLISMIQIDSVNKDNIEKISNAISFYPRSILFDSIKNISNLNEKHSNTTTKLGKKITSLQEDSQKYAQYLNDSLINGNTNDARLAIAEMRLTGRYLDQNFQEAFKMYTFLANKNNNNDMAQFQLAECYEKGIGTMVNEDECIKYYRLSADKGNKEALFKLADKLIEIKKSTSKIKQKDVLHYLEEAAKRGHTNSQYQIGKMYQKGKELKQSYLLAIDNFKTAALNGHQKAAKRYVNLVRSKAITSKNKKSDNNSNNNNYNSNNNNSDNNSDNNNSGNNNSGNNNENNNYNITDNNNNNNLINKKSDDNNNNVAVSNDQSCLDEFTSIADSKTIAMAQYVIGNMYLKGIGVEKNEEKAADFFKRAADDTSAPFGEAATKYGDMLMRGGYGGVSKNTLSAAKYYEIAAKGGSSDGAFKLGEMYESGNVVPHDEKKAAKNYRIAADYGHPLAAYRYALMIDEGRIRSPTSSSSLISSTLTSSSLSSSLTSSLKSLSTSASVTSYKSGCGSSDALRYFRIAAENGNDDAALRIGRAYRDGIENVVEPNEIEAQRYLEISASKNNAVASFLLAQLYQNRSQMNECMNCYRKSAELGNADAAHSLGTLYENDRTYQDYVEAAKYYQIAANKGHLLSIYSLALLYENGFGVPQSDLESFRLYQLGSNRGHVDSTYRLGLYYEIGKGVERDDRQAVKLFQSASDNGSKDAMTELALLTLNGRGVTKNSKRAIRLLQTANSPSSNYHLGMIYLKGEYEDIQKDVLLAAKYLYTATQEKDNRAAQKLGEMYLEGIGVEKNEDTAQQYFRTAAELGNKNSAFSLFKVLEKSNEDESKKLAYKYLEIAAQNHHEEAAYRFAELIEEGTIEGAVAENAYHYYGIAANNGNKDAAYKVGIHYKDIPEYYENSVRNLLIASNQGHADASYYLGTMLIEGKGVIVDEQQGIMKILSAADKGNSLAQLYLGRSYLRGLHKLQNDEEKALFYLEKSAETNADAMYELGAIYEIRNDVKSAVKLFMEAADKGQINAATTIGESYMKGLRGFDKDANKAIQYLTIAAENRDPISCMKLIEMYREGNYTPQSKEFLNNIVKISAENNHPYGSFLYGKSLEEEGERDRKEEGKEGNYEIASRYFQIASDNDIPEATYKLGVMFEEGKGVEKNDKEAMKLYTKSSSKGNADSQFRLAMMYAQGRGGLEQSSDEAKKLFKVSADAGNPSSAYQYALFCNENNNKQETIKYLRISMKGKNHDAAVMLGFFLQNESINNNYNNNNNKDNLHSEGDFVDAFKEASDLGNVVGMYQYGLILRKQGKNDEALEYFQKAAKGGQADAAFEYGKSLEDSNPQIAGQYYRRAVELSHGEACYRLGLMIFEGRGFQQNQTEASQYLKVGTNLNNANCLFLLGNMTELGKGVYRNDNEALNYYIRSSQLGNIEAAYRIGVMYELGKATNVFNDLKSSSSNFGFGFDDQNTLNSEALKYYKIAADNGHIKAASKFASLLEIMSNKSIMMNNSTINSNNSLINSNNSSINSNNSSINSNNSTINSNNSTINSNNSTINSNNSTINNNNINEQNENISLAIQYHKIAADKGECDSAFALGRRYEFGWSVDKDLSLSCHYYKIAADSTSSSSTTTSTTTMITSAITSTTTYKVEAQFKYAQMLESGLGVQQNEQEAVKYYYEAAKGNHIEAIFILGMLFFEGKWVAKDNEQALEYFKIGAKGGNLNSAYMIGTMLEMGDGTQKDVVEAANFYRQAADRHHQLSAQRLADLYRVGVGVPRDPQMSMHYQRIAAMPI